MEKQPPSESDLLLCSAVAKLYEARGLLVMELPDPDMPLEVELLIEEAISYLGALVPEALLSERTHP